MDEAPLPRTLAEFPYVTVRLACMHCPKRHGRYRLARLAAQFGADAGLEAVLFELTRSCRWQVPPGTRRRKYVPYCRAYFRDLMYRPPPDEPPPSAGGAAVRGRPTLRVVGNED